MRSEAVTEQEKACTRCGEFWPADEEFFRRRSPSCPRLAAWCRACEAEQKAESRAAQAERKKLDDGAI